MAKYLSMKTVAVIPAYFEEKRIDAAVRDVARFVDAVVVVDDCSGDETFARAHAAGAHVLRHIVNLGQGAALQTGTDYAVEKLHADIVVHFDADGQMAGEDVVVMIDPIVRGEADVVLGSRFLGKNVNMPRTRRIALAAGLVFTRLMSGIRTTDTHNGFRALSRDAVRKARITLDRMAHASEILDLVQLHKLRYVERPVTITYTEATLHKGAAGQSPLRMFVVAKDFIAKRFLD